MDPDQLAGSIEGLRRLARSLVFDATAADDIVQETLTIAIENPPADSVRTRGWLHGVCRNVARRFVRGEMRRNRREEHVARREAAVHSTQDLVVRAAEQRRIIDAVVALREPYRSTVFRRFFDDVPPRIIARDEGIPVETVRTRITRGLAYLRKDLDRQHDGDRRAWMALLLPAFETESEAVGATFLGGILVMSAGNKIALSAALIVVLSLLFFLREPSRPADDIGPRSAQSSTESYPELAARTTPSEPPPARDATQATSATPMIEGRVTDAGGAPIDGARIYLGSPDRTLTASGNGQARTDASGAFALRVPVGAEIFRVGATAHGYMAASTLFTPTRPEFVDMRLDRLPEFAFQVLDGDTGKPIGGVEATQRDYRSDFQVELRAVSDETGTIRMFDSAGWRGDGPAIRLLHPDYEPVLHYSPRLETGDGTHSYRDQLYMRRGEPLQVRAVEARTEIPADAASITAWLGLSNHLTLSEQLEPEASLAFLGTATSDADGTARFGVGNRQRFLVVARKADSLGIIGKRWNPRGQPLVVPMHPAVAVSGRVLTTGGIPRGDVVVRIRLGDLVASDMAWSRLDTRTDAMGRFRFPLVPFADRTRPLTISASMNNLATAAKDLWYSPDGVDVDLSLEQSASALSFLVRDDAGAAVAGARIGYIGVSPHVRTDASGKACLWTFRETLERTIQIQAPGYTTHVLRLETLPAEGVTIEVDLAPARPAAGTLIDESGNGTSGVVDLYAPEYDPSSTGYGLGTADPQHYDRAEADPRGHFRFESPPPGPYFVRAWHGPPSLDPGFTGIVDDLDGVRLVLPAATPTSMGRALVEGMVFAADGTRLTRYRATLRSAERLLQPQLAGWKLRFTDVEPGDYELLVTADTERARLAITVRPGDDVTDLRIQLAAPARLAGRLLDPDGSPVANATVVVQTADTDGFVTTARVDAQGTFTASRIAPGDYRLQVLATQGGRPFQVRDGYFSLTSGGSSSLDFSCVPAGRVALVVNDDRFPPTRVNLTDPRGPRSLTTIVVIEGRNSRIQRDTLLSGRTLISEPLLPGSCSIRITDPLSGTFARRIEIVAGQTQDVLVELPPDQPR